MGLQDTLTHFAEPRMHFVSGGMEGLARLVREIEYKAISNGGFLARIDGARAQDVDGLFREFAISFGFPEYFGRNWAAFHECINDLDWLSASYYVTCLTDTASLLRNSEPDLRTLIRLLDWTTRDWATRDRGGDPLAGAPRPFHVVFCADSDCMPHTLRRLESAGLTRFDVTRI